MLQSPSGQKRGLKPVWNQFMGHGEGVSSFLASCASAIPNRKLAPGGGWQLAFQQPRGSGLATPRATRAVIFYLFFVVLFIVLFDPLCGLAQQNPGLESGHPGLYEDYLGVPGSTTVGLGCIIETIEFGSSA